MPDYSKGKIYKLVCNVTRLCYIGSTTCTLNHRKSNHSRDFTRFNKGKCNYVTSFDIIKGGYYKIELIEDFPCTSKAELLDRENYYINSIDCVNKLNAVADVNYSKEYRIKNKDSIKAKKSEPYTCACGSTIWINSKSRHEKSKKHLEYISKNN
jgi:hypothetical protein